MTDMMFLPVWLALSWLIRQVENGIQGNETADEEELEPGQELAASEVNFEPYEPIAQAIKVGIAAFSLLLLGLSIYAYNKTRLKAIIYAAVAFALFAGQMLLDYLEDTVPSVEGPFNDIIFLGMTLAILVLFFTAIVRKR